MLAIYAKTLFFAVIVRLVIVKKIIVHEYTSTESWVTIRVGQRFYVVFLDLDSIEK